MAKANRPNRPEARLPKGFRDTPADEVRQLSQMLGVIRGVYESYGFEPLETPAIEYTEALGKFLPDLDRVLDAVDRVTNRQLDRRIEGRRAGDPDSLISDPARLKATLGWEPRHADLETIIAHALAWERKLTDLKGEP